MAWKKLHGAAAKAHARAQKRGGPQRSKRPAFLRKRGRARR